MTVLDLFRTHYAGLDTTCRGRSELWRRRRRRDHGAHCEVGHSGSRNQSSTQREEEVQGEPQVMYDLNAEPVSKIYALKITTN